MSGTALWNRVRTIIGAAIAVAALATPAMAATPSSVTVAGSFQSEVGCAGDWDPTCAQSMLARGAADGVWRGTFDLPAGAYEYKAAIDGSWNENYGVGGTAGGSNIPFAVGAQTAVRFYYDEVTHWVTDSVNSAIVTAAGDFQSELGCPGDWQPDCLRSWLEDPDGDGTSTFTTTAIPAGNYQVKAAIDEGWSENYGDGGVPGGANISFVVPADAATTTFSYVGATHVLTVTSVAADVTPPLIVAEPDPAAPDGASGWYVGSPTVAFSVTDPESAITAETGCDPTTVATDGTVTFTCTATSAGGTASASVTIQRDATPPAITCPATPTFLLRAPTAVVTADVTDATSGAALPSVGAAVDASAVGSHLAGIAAADVAGNAAATTCPYIVGYGVAGLSPRSGQTVRTGADLTVRFSLVDARGLPIAASEARRIAGSCAARISIDGTGLPRICLGYDAGSRTFRWEAHARGRLGRGSHLLGITVTAPDGTVVARAATTVSVR